VCIVSNILKYPHNPVSAGQPKATLARFTLAARKAQAVKIAPEIVR
jgi:hypothetical protein